MSATGPELAGMLAGCGLAAAALVSADPLPRRIAVAGALVLAPLLVLASVWNEPRVIAFRGDAGAIAAAIIGAAAAIALLAALFRRLPVAFAVLAVALLSLRVPVEIGGERANLLIPLYTVIAGGALASFFAPEPPADAGRERLARWPRLLSPAGASGALRWLLAATLLLYAAQAAYSEDVSNAIELTGFFLIPFAAMFALLADVEWDRRTLALGLVAVAAMAVGFAGVAIYQYAARDLFINPALLESNQLHQYFRVNSLFYDPNILGRYLGLALVALAAYLAWAAARARLVLAVGASGVILAGMAFTFSITSFAALFAALGLLAALRWRARGLAATAVLAVLAAAVFVAVGGAPESDLADQRAIDSGRTDLVSGGLELAAERPLAGWGSGSFGAAFSQRFEARGATVSHSEPVTVAAEQGAPGLIVYVPLMLVSLVVLLGRAPAAAPARAAIAACFVAMFVHSLGYAGFTTDPATWALLALGVALREQLDLDD